jgi:hypothetical protein
MTNNWAKLFIVQKPLQKEDFINIFLYLTGALNNTEAKRSRAYNSIIYLTVRDIIFSEVCLSPITC